MVAYTNSQMLPYQTGLDRPCDLDDVWCDLATKVDSKLQSLDLLLDRVNPAVPAAKITRSTDIAFTGDLGSQSLTFEAVEFDTDQMVNLSRSAFNILPRRPGNYLVAGYCDITIASTSAVGLEMQVATMYNLATVRADGLRIPNSGTFRMVYRIISTYNVSEDSLDLQLGFGMRLNPAGGLTSIITITSLELSAYWINDGSL